MIILLSIILVPIAIFLIYNFTDFNLWFSNEATLKIALIKLLCPTVFSISWLFFLILFAERFADTLDDFDRTISVVPSRLKFFYGINAVYILFIFIFPLITPVISVLSFASFAWRLTTFRKKRWIPLCFSFPYCISFHPFCAGIYFRKGRPSFPIQSKVSRFLRNRSGPILWP